MSGEQAGMRSTCEALSYKDEARGWIWMVYSVSFMVLLLVIHHTKTWKVAFGGKKNMIKCWIQRQKNNSHPIHPAKRWLKSENGNKEPVVMFLWQHLFKPFNQISLQQTVAETRFISYFDESFTTIITQWKCRMRIITVNLSSLNQA